MKKKHSYLSYSQQEDQRLEKKKQKDFNKALKKAFQDSHKQVLGGMVTTMFSRKVDTSYIIHCGKTNSGKTYNAIEALKVSGNGVYLAPLRLLAWEVYDKLNEQGYPCSLLTGEEQMINEGDKYMSSTIEMLRYDTFYDTVVIDEAFCISDNNRGKSWTKALLDVNAREVHVIVNEEALDLIVNILTLTHRKHEVKRYEMLQKFTFSETPTHFSSYYPKGTIFVTFSRMNVLLNRSRLQHLSDKPVSVLYGNLPPETKKIQIQNFIEGKSDYMVATDVLGMGVNVPCNAIVFLEVRKYDGDKERHLTPIEVRQIAGRVGRFGLSSADSFVSAGDNYKLSYITSAYNEPQKLTKAYVGFDYEMFTSFDQHMRVKDRIMAFHDINFVPQQLTQFIAKESITKYLSIAELVDKRAFTLDVKWNFLTASIKNTNKEYFEACVRDYSIDGKIAPPLIVSTSDIKSLEDNISEIELYLSLTRTLNHDSAEREEYKSLKYELIELLNEKLMDRKLAIKKKCKLCPEMLDITYPHGYCHTCYSEKMRNSRRDYWD